MRCVRASPTPINARPSTQLQRARWAGGDPRAAREALRRAFTRGVRLEKPARAAGLPDPLPPLYPPA